jgi:two-component system sensor histidine kinase RpfC
LGIVNPLEAVARLRARLRARPDSEHEQAILRIVIVTVVLTVMAFVYEGDARHGALLIYGLAVTLGFAVCLFVAICASPGANVQRRLIGSLADNGAATFVMFMTGQAGFSMLGVYLFVAFGNGFRYGRKYLFVSQALALVGYTSVLLFHPWWGAYQPAGWSLFVALVVLPVYVSTLLERIHDAQRRAEEANLAKSSFLANMSHEMRTPLNGIVGVADLIKATPLDAQQSELVRLLTHSTMLLRSLVDDVLDISKIEAGRLAIEISEFDLHATLNGVVHLLRPHAESKGLGLRAMIDPAIDYTLRGDQHHLRQVLLNLLSNAVKFTHRGEINVDVTLTGETADGVGIRFEVRDTGIGIAPEAQARIFEAFVQADDSTTRRFGGTGLGTTIAKQLVELMGGTIGVQSKVGEGSLFWFELPLLKAKAAAAEGARPAEKSAGLVVGESQSAGDVAGVVARTVGAVEAVPTARDAVTHLDELRSRGVNVSAIVVSGGVDEAVRVFEELGRARKDPGVALIYCAADPASARREPALRRIPGLQVVGREATQRHMRNAIHAATTRDLGESGEVIDLASVLQQQRQPVRVLVAEDNATNLAILRQLLESAGHTVYAAIDGEEALDLYEAKAPELAILDFNMPERNGVEVTAAIRTMEPAGVRLPVIILSAAVTVEARERARLGGADEFVGKPFDAATLLQVIDRLARRSTRTSAHPAPGAVAVPAARTPSAVDALPLMDANRFAEVERIASTPDFLDQLLRGFHDDVELLLRKLDAALGSGQAAVVGDTLHALKGAAVSIGATQLAARSKAMEDMAQSGQVAQVLAAAPALRQCFDGTARAIASLAERRHRASL